MWSSCPCSFKDQLIRKHTSSWLIKVIVFTLLGSLRVFSDPQLHVANVVAIFYSIHKCSPHFPVTNVRDETLNHRNMRHVPKTNMTPNAGFKIRLINLYYRVHLAKVVTINLDKIAVWAIPLEEGQRKPLQHFLNDAGAAFVLGCCGITGRFMYILSQE